MASGPTIDESGGMRFPQFRLRTLLGVFALLAVLFSTMGMIGPLASAGLLLALTIVGLHIAGNAIGTSLRDNASAGIYLEARTKPSQGLPPTFRANLPISRLRQRTPLGWIVGATTLLGIGFGAGIGWLMLAGRSGDLDAGLVVGSISFAVLGGFFGFLLGSFLKTSLAAWWQAVGTSKQDRHQPYMVIPTQISGESCELRED